MPGGAASSGGPRTVAATGAEAGHAPAPPAAPRREPPARPPATPARGFPSGALRPGGPTPPRPRAGPWAEIAATVMLLAALLVLLVEPLRGPFLRTFWDPILVDALNRDSATLGGRFVHAGLSGTPGAAVGLLLVAAFLVSFEPFRRHGHPFDDRMVLAALPWVALAPALVVLQDTGWPPESIVFLHVWPLAWVALGAGLAGSLAWGTRMAYRARHGMAGVPRWEIPAVLTALLAANLLLEGLGVIGVPYDPPLWAHVAALAATVSVWWGATHLGRRPTARTAVFTVGLLFVGLVGAVLAAWIAWGVRWEPSRFSLAGVAAASPPTTGGVPGFLVPPLFATVATSVAIAAVAGYLRRGRGLRWLGTFATGPNAAVLFAHAWDAWVAWSGRWNPWDLPVEWNPERNPVAAALLDWEPLHGGAYLLVKLAAVGALLLLLDRSPALAERLQWKGLAKLALLGIALVPATEAALRAAAGV